MPNHVPSAFSARVNPPWLDSLGAFGWREVVLLLAALLALYVLVAYLRLRRIGRPSPPPVEQVPSPPSMPEPLPDVAPPSIAPIAPPVPEPELPKPPVLAAEPAELPWVRTPEQRDELRRLEVIESEIVSMRSQIESLHETMAMLVEQLRQEYVHEQHEHLHDPVAPAPSPLMPASPLYGEAMQLALAGLAAQDIAERCGIARAEAELVVALAQQDEGLGGDASGRSGGNKINDMDNGGGRDGGQGRY